MKCLQITCSTQAAEKTQTFVYRLSTARQEPARSTEVEGQLIALVLHGVTSVHSRSSYRTGLEGFFAWIRVSGAGPGFTKALAQQYRSALLANRLSSSTINLRLSPIRKLAREMADNQMLDPATAAAIEQ